MMLFVRFISGTPIKGPQSPGFRTWSRAKIRPITPDGRGPRIVPARHQFDIALGEQFVGVAHRVKRRRVFLIFLRKDAIVWQPFVEFQVLKDFLEIGANARQQHGDTAFFRVAQEVLDVFHGHDVVPRSPQAKHQILDACRSILLDFFECTVQLRRRAEEEFALRS